MTDTQTMAPTEGVDGETLRLAALLESDPAPIPCEDGELGAVDFSRMDVLIGTVRNDEQFDYCMESKAYYIPAGTVDPADLPVAFVALYEEGLTRKAGIKRYGRVTETRVVKRRDIPVPMSRPNPEETYYLFTVESWEYLPHPIALLNTARGKPAFTNEFLLTHCRRSYQLVAIRSPEAYRLCALLCDPAIARGDTPVLRRVGDRHILSVTKGTLRLLTAEGGCLYTCPARMLTEMPAEVLRGVGRGLGIGV
ncbi:MAG: hypothetical protein J6M42_02050 [Clostridia bacterium]|nr:hypothetical protein [Clostridia bacterium]